MTASCQASSGDDVPAPSERSFGLVFTAVFVVVALAPLLHDGTVRLWSLTVAALFLLLALALPRVLRPLSRAWLKLGLAMHRFVNPVVMGILFFGVITPTGWAMRRFGKAPIDARLDRGRASYWVHRAPPGPAPATMSEQF